MHLAGPASTMSMHCAVSLGDSFLAPWPDQAALLTCANVACQPRGAVFSSPRRSCWESHPEIISSITALVYPVFPSSDGLASICMTRFVLSKLSQNCKLLHQIHGVARARKGRYLEQTVLYPPPPPRSFCQTQPCRIHWSQRVYTSH